MRALSIRTVVWAGVLTLSAALLAACVGDSFVDYEVVNDTTRTS